MKTTKTIKSTKKSVKSIAQSDASPKMRISQSALAARYVARFDALTAELALEPMLTTDERRALTGGVTVPTAFVEELATVATRFGARLGTSFNSDGARESIAYVAAFAPVVRAARAFAERLEDHIMSRRAAVGSSALATYAAMKGLARTPEGKALNEPVKELNALIRHARKPQTKVASPSASPPAPPNGAPQVH